MATIKDIAKLAKTSQGTVSNVLNNKGNVSSEKIKRVLDAAKELNYIPNINAKNLRKGYTEQMYLIIPNLESQVYMDIYKSFLINATSDNYEINLLITNNDATKEFEYLEQLIPEINSGMKVAIVTSLSYGSRYKQFPKDLLDNIIFVLKDYIDSKHFISFDYKHSATEITNSLTQNSYSNVCIFSNRISSSIDTQFIDLVKSIGNESNIEINTIEIDPFRAYQSILESVKDFKFDAVILLDYEFESVLKNVLSNFSLKRDLPIYAISPLSLFRDSSLIRFEVDYNILGREAIVAMKSKEVQVSNSILPCIGIRDWLPTIEKRKEPVYLKLLSVDNPSALILKNLAIQYSLLTNIHVSVDVFDYDTVYELLSSGKAVSEYDIIRCDINWMDWFAKEIYKPLNIEDKIISEINKTIIPEVRNFYLSDKKNLYALPFSPSSQVLFYRKDLFERADLKRLYLEQNKKELCIPHSFEEFDNIAKFFTKEFNPDSPTSYGMTLTTGNSGVSGSELLCRYYSFEDTILDSNSNINLNMDALVETLESLRNASKYSNPNRPKWWTDTAQEFANGDTAMAIMFSNYAPELLSLNSKVIGKIGQALIPGDNPLLGGGAIGISKGTSNEKESLDFITWISKETISSQASFLGNLPGNTSTFNYREIMDEYPWFETTKNSITISKCSRTHIKESQNFNEREFLQVIGDKEVINSLVKENKSEEIAKVLMQKIKENSKYLIK